MFSLNKQKKILDASNSQWRAKSGGEMMQLNLVDESASASGPKNIDLFQFLSCPATLPQVLTCADAMDPCQNCAIS